MSRFGLALSGGGFRATLYHLGVLRFLRDANILSKVSHITSVSGGSIVAAHLVMNWSRYTGSEKDYDDAAAELLDFVRLDVRNRVVRRFPMAAVANWMRMLMRKGRSRRLTRPGILEAQYEKFLYGDKCLYELPSTPQLHILSTNINEGCLCSFTRSGLLIERRLPDGGTRFEAVPSALATIPMAVTASSAFPGFFPPLQLTANDVGTDESRFPPHLFTDGGVYDNLGVRMFRHIQQSWIGHDTPLRPEDFVDLPTATDLLLSETETASDAPFRRLGQLVRKRWRDQTAGTSTSPIDAIPSSLWSVVVHDQLYRESAFENLKLDDAQAEDLLGLSRRGRKLDTGDHLWLNRYLAQTAFADAGHGKLLVGTKTEFDAVIVSDSGKRFSVSRRSKSGGLLGTAMRATDILMNRVWQLEKDQFGAEADFVFAPLSSTVHLGEDPTALHPEIQIQVANTRTDLDRFTDLEISGLIRHGYGVMRKTCRSRPDLFGDDLPADAPWDPTSFGSDVAIDSASGASDITQQARELQGASQRKILRPLLSLRDWPTYVFVPLLLMLLLGAPYFAYVAYKNASRAEMIVDAITFSNPDFQIVLQLARQNPVPGTWETIELEEVDKLQPTTIGEFELITDTRIFDLRAWRPDSTDKQHPFVGYRRMRVRRLPISASGDLASEEDLGLFRFQQPVNQEDFELRCNAKNLNPVFRIADAELRNGQMGRLVEGEFDLSNVPDGETFDISFEVRAYGEEAERQFRRRFLFPIVAETHMATMWVLLPNGRPAGEFTLVSYDPALPKRVESINPTYKFTMADGTMFGWMLVAPREDYMYECRWEWRYE